MGSLVSGTITVANPVSFSLSGWFNIPSSPSITGFGDDSSGARGNPGDTAQNAATTLIEFGDCTTESDNGTRGPQFSQSSALALQIDSGGKLQVIVQIYVPFYPGDDSFNPFQQNIFFASSAALMPLGLSLDKWHHIALAVQLSQSVNSAGAFFTTYNNVSFGRLVIDAATQYSSNTVAFGSSLFATPQAAPVIGINGGKIGLPRLSPTGFVTAETSSITHRYYAVQGWFGKFIDPTSPGNYSKLVKISGGKGIPVPVKTATAAFGAQSFLFSGTASSGAFFRNGGTLGTFVKSGTANDIKPTPSF